MSRALIVDDKEENLLYLRALLEGNGWTVEAARHGAEALAMARRTPPELVISDLLMPVMDGYTLLRSWKADPRLQRVPFIIYTATYTDSEDEQLALDLGADAFILKPTEPADFLQAVRDVLACGAATCATPGVAGSDANQLYSATLVRKLEQRSLELERTNHALALDIAARIQAEEALREREERLRVLFELSEVLRSEAGPDQVLPAALRIAATHLRVQRCVYASLAPDADHYQVHHDSTERSTRVIGRHLLTSLTRRIAASFTAGGGSLVVRDVVAELAGDERAEVEALGIRAFVCCPVLRGGALRAVLAVGVAAPRDWTSSELLVIEDVVDRCASAIEQRAAESRRRQDEALLRIAGHAAHLGGWSVELASLDVIWSDEVCAIHEVPIGTRPSVARALAYYAPESRELVAASVQACARDGTPFDLEIQLITAPHRRVWVRSVGHAERDATGAITRIQGALQDIDDRKKLQEQLRQAQKMEAVGQLAGGVAHDFNNLLSVILSYTDFLIEDVGPDATVRDDLEQIRRAGQRASALTRQLLAFSRQQVLAPRVLDVTQVVGAMQALLHRLLGEDIQLSVVTARDLGKIYADPSQVEQIVMNLAVNARDAMPRGGRLVIELSNVELGAAHAADHEVAPGSYVLLAVSDTGTGMDVATCQRVFEPFFTTKDKAKGTGLGLSTVFGIVAQSQGHVTVDSEVGRGSTFRVYLPRTDKPLEPAPPVAEPVTLCGSETILVVEDEEQVRTMTRAILRRHGYNVLEAANGGEAFMICEQYPRPIHLLVSDVVMPRMNGRELAARLTAMRPDLRVLYVSGYTEDAFPQHGLPDDGSEFLSKPITPDTLLHKLREILDQ